jgi:hypothetical protein
VGAVLAVLPPEGVAAEPLSPHPTHAIRSRSARIKARNLTCFFTFFPPFSYTYDNTVETVFSTLLEFERIHAGQHI